MSDSQKIEEVELLRLDDVHVHFPVHSGVLFQKTGAVKAVDGVSFSIKKGETLGLVGESGCGKSTLGKAIVRLLAPTAGHIFFKGHDISHQSQSQLRRLRQDFQMVFQDPSESLDARMSVGEIIEEPLVVQSMGNSKGRHARVLELLDRVGLPAKAVDRFPFEFSGGQRQRIGIARALAVSPDLLILDEPVSALDVSVQSQVMNLLLELQRDLGLSYLFIAHDLAVVKHMSDRVAVMYLGKIMELAQADEIYHNPRHAYTRALLSAIPEPDPSLREKRVILRGEVPSPLNPPPGCAFGHRVGHVRYPESIEMDLQLTEIAPGHFVQNCPCCVV